MSHFDGLCHILWNGEIDELFHGAFKKTLLRNNLGHFKTLFPNLWHRRLKAFLDVRDDRCGCHVLNHTCGNHVLNRHNGERHELENCVQPRVRKQRRRKSQQAEPRLAKPHLPLACSSCMALASALWIV